ncbi:MAG: tRNA uridine-5-carboxymethylaminomethyl(34) synthesis GTPase MnmE [Devosiaceae bacterium]
MTATIAALSSGLVPSGVAVIRVSGPAVQFALEKVAGGIPPSRLAVLRTLRDPYDLGVLDQALVLYFPGPNSFTGEDVAEFHCHGGRAVVAGVLSALCGLDGISPAEAGAFTRQAFANGKLDLTQVEAVGDLIHATTQLQREQAISQLGGAASKRLMAWRQRIAEVRALIEANLDFSDEDDVPGSVLDSLPQQLENLIQEMNEEASNHLAERLRDGFSVVLAGAPNSGKSTLLNALLDREAALVSPVAGTTRDQIDVPIDLDGLPVILSDTAGLRDATDDVIEAMGIARTRGALRDADLVVYLESTDNSQGVGLDDQSQQSIRIRSKSDLTIREAESSDQVELDVSGVTGEGLHRLRLLIGARLREQYRISAENTVGDGVSLDARRRTAVGKSVGHLTMASSLLQLGIERLEQAAEELRLAQKELGLITGDVDTEGVLNVLFSRFCIGK